MENGQQDVSIGQPVDCHGRATPMEPQSPQHGDTAAAMDGLGRLGALSTWRTGLVPGHG